MTAPSILHIAGLFVPVATSEMLNGIARTIYLNKQVGVMNAKKISLLPALARCLLICYYYAPLLRIRTDKGLLVLGVSLSLFMGLFDIMVARFIVKARWDTILDDFNIVKGNLLGLGMVAMGLLSAAGIEDRPFLKGKLVSRQVKRDRESDQRFLNR